MADKTFSVRIANRYDTKANWTANGTQVLMAGEIAFQTQVIDGKAQPFLYVGDGVTPISGLNSVKVNAEDVIGLEDKISASAANTKYQLVQDGTDSTKWHLQSCEDTTVATPVWTTVSTLTIPAITTGSVAGSIGVGGVDVAVNGFKAVSDKADANETAIATLNGSNTTEGSVAKTVKDAVDGLNTSLTNEINSKLSSTYKAAGSLAPDGLTADKLVAANEGKVYNITGSFTTTDSFIEGAGKTIQTGANVVVVNTAATPEDTAVYKFDIL